MTYFEPDFIDFFRELAQNNHKEWFDENRKRYAKVVKEPFKVFVEDLIRHLAAQNHDLIGVEPKNCIFRINRDIRFSKDKTPYKTNVSASVAPAGKKDMETPGVYIELDADELKMYSGVYMPEKEQLHKLRSHISQNLEEFKGLHTNEAFVQHFGRIQGDRNKIVPKEFKPFLDQEPLMANKQFYFFKRYPSSILTSETLMPQLLEDHQVMKPLMEFFKEGLE